MSQLPKNITDAIDNFEGKAVDHWMHDHYGTDRATFDAKRQLVTDARAALEAAIAELVEPPTDAEVEAWAKEVFSLSIDAGTICAGTPSDVGAENEAFVVHRGELEAGLALMRRARATGSLERLRERVQKTIDVTPRSALLGMLLTVRDWIDEERGAGR